MIIKRLGPGLGTWIGDWDWGLGLGTGIGDGGWDGDWEWKQRVPPIPGDDSIMPEATTTTTPNF